MEQNKNHIEAVKDLIRVTDAQKKSFISLSELREAVSNEAVDMLRNVTDNCVHIGGGDYRINEAYLEPARQFLKNITDE